MLTDSRRFVQWVAGFISVDVAGCNEAGESGETTATRTSTGTDSLEASPMIIPSATLQPNPTPTPQSSLTPTALSSRTPTSSATRTPTAQQTTPAESGKFVAADGDADDTFGWSVAVDNGTALIGASQYEDPNGENAGSAYVFERANGTWRQLAKLVPADGDFRDMFGNSTALTGETALIGAHGDEDPNGDDAGSAYVYDV